MLQKALTKTFLLLFILMNTYLGEVAAGVSSDSFPEGTCSLEFTNVTTKKTRNLDLINDARNSADCQLKWAVHGDGSPRLQHDTEAVREEEIVLDLETAKQSLGLEVKEPVVTTESLEGATQSLFCGCFPIRRSSTKRPKDKSMESSRKGNDGYEDFLSFGGQPFAISKTFPSPSLGTGQFTFRNSDGLNQLMPLLIVSQILFMHEVGRDNIKAGATLTFEGKRVVVLDYSTGCRIKIEIPTPRGTRLQISLLERSAPDTEHAPVSTYVKQWNRDTASQNRPFCLTGKVMAESLTTNG